MTRLIHAAAALAAIAFALVGYVYLTLPDVRVLRTENPTTTAFMELRDREARASGKPRRREHRWLALGRISANLKRAVLVAEDDAFWQHEGVDLEQLRETLEEDLARGRPMRGASTITQQLAKNLYLSPSRDPLRKLRELVIARRLEAALSKDRIFELYLNLIEWGDGVWGADAAARRYFGSSASSLSADQAALMAGAIVNPRLLVVTRPSRRLVRRQAMILSRMRTVTPPGDATPPVQPAPPAPPESEPVTPAPVVQGVVPADAAPPD
ncbi:MAG: monofunctional biosynthetic peptidoglycan transglycosylase [Vicinamibacterales bacterium]|nr:monofunctional biosynthetic peptidoglycan transglycosylase [Vicinamibacterales bacterium]